MRVVCTWRGVGACVRAYKSKGKRWLHAAEEERYRWWYYDLTLPGLLIGLLAGMLSLLTQVVGGANTCETTWLGFGLGCAMLLATALQGASQLIGAAEKISTWRRWELLVLRLEQQLGLRRRDRTMGSSSVTTPLRRCPACCSTSQRCGRRRSNSTRR